MLSFSLLSSRAVSLVFLGSLLCSVSWLKLFALFGSCAICVLHLSCFLHVSPLIILLPFSLLALRLLTLYTASFPFRFPSPAPSLARNELESGLCCDWGGLAGSTACRGLMPIPLAACLLFSHCRCCAVHFSLPFPLGDAARIGVGGWASASSTPLSFVLPALISTSHDPSRLRCRSQCVGGWPLL